MQAVAVVVRKERLVIPPRSRLAWARRPWLLLLLLLAVAGLTELGIHYWPDRLLVTARAALTRREYDVARAALLRFLEARPNNAEAHLLLAQLDRRANRYADAAAP